LVLSGGGSCEEQEEAGQKEEEAGVASADHENSRVRKIPVGAGFGGFGSVGLLCFSIKRQKRYNNNEKAGFVVFVSLKSRCFLFDKGKKIGVSCIYASGFGDSQGLYQIEIFLMQIPFSHGSGL